MIEIAFIFTTVVILTGSVQLLALILGNSITLPMIIPILGWGPTHFLIWYPSAMFQVWFWAEKLGVFL